MSKIAYSFALACALSAIPGFSESWMDGKAADVFNTTKGELKIIFLGHSSLIFIFKGAYFYIDPVSEYGHYSDYPKADAILVTHEHFDHLDPKVIDILSNSSTRIVVSGSTRAKLGKGELLEHGAQLQIAGLGITAVPAYNVTVGRTNYHPKGRHDNGYIISIGELRIYIAGDTEPIPEMGNFGRIDIAFLPMNQPYTMTPEQVAMAVAMIKPKILYPYHFGSTDTNALIKLLKNDKETEVRIRKLQ